MGVDYSGGMIIGEIGKSITNYDGYDNIGEWAEEHGMDKMALYYDADEEDCYFGFPIANIVVSEIDQKWVDDLKAKASLFEKLSGVPAKLIGTQNIW